MNRALPIILLVFALGFFFYTERAEYFSQQEADLVKPIHVWAASIPAQTLEQLKAEFERLHPEFRVEVQAVAWGSLQEKTLWAVAANSNVPDLIVGSSEWVGGLANAGALEPFDKHMDDQFWHRFFPAALGTYQFPEVQRDEPGVRGAMRQYGIPLDLDMMLFFYRSDVVDPLLAKLGMKEFPKDWANFEKLAESVRDQGGAAPDAPRLLQLDPEDPVPLRMAFLPASGGMLFNKEMTRATFDSAEAQAAFTFFSNLISSDAALSWNRNTMGDAFDVIKSGRILGNIAGPWFGKLLELRAPELAGKWRVALFPKREPQYPSCGLGGACLVTPYNAPNRRGAVALAKYMADNAFALEYFKRVGSPPPQISAWNNPVFDESSPYFGGQQVYKVVRQAIEQSRPLQLMPNAEIVKSHVRWALSEISRDRADVPSTLAKAVKQSNQLLSTR